MAQEEPSAADVAQARQLFYRGVEALRSSDWTAACDAFERSNALVETAQTHQNLAVCTGELGRLLDQSEHLRAFLRLAGEDVDADRARTARAQLAEIEPRVPRLVVRVQGELPDGAIVRVAGAEVPHAVLGTERPVNPGSVRVEAEAEGYADFARTIEVAEGDRSIVDLSLVPLPSTAASAGTGAGEGDDTQPDAGVRPQLDDDEGGSVLSSPWLWITVGVVVVAAGVVAIVLLSDSDPDPAQFPDGTSRFEALRF